MRQETIFIIIMLGILIASLFGVLYLYTNPCQEFKTSCHYGTRNTYAIDCGDPIDSVPEGYSVHRETRCVKR